MEHLVIRGVAPFAKNGIVFAANARGFRRDFVWQSLE